MFAGRWIEYSDTGKRHFAQPDFFRVDPTRVTVFEVKLTQCPAGELQISQLYRPLLECIYQRPVIGVLVCRTLWYKPQALILNPEDALRIESDGVLTLHWLGR